MTQLPDKLATHKRACYRCYKADSIVDLCRIGRRLFLAWFRNLNQDDQMFALVAMPPEERSRVKNFLDIGENVVFGDKLHE